MFIWKGSLHWTPSEYVPSCRRRSRVSKAEGAGSTGAASCKSSRTVTPVVSKIFAFLTLAEYDDYDLSKHKLNSWSLRQAATQKAKNSEGNKTRRFRFSRRTTSTAIQVAVDHAFTGTYVDRFRPNDPPEARECPCGHRTRSSLHIIHSCTRFNAARLQAHIPLIPNNPTRFSCVIGPGRKDAERLLNFIQESHALTHPEAGPREEVPPEPD
ncbi:hypothetical protein EDB85DRAFT_1896001 [Lactarius pseudohatsudake]|nr:hypothetical protein EDB85DRAFT_1896001 [Lactarius pseudohatsudake]